MGIELGQILDGKYRVTACIGEGGMGAVYAGEHLKVHRKVAIKVLHAAVATNPEVVMRFEREAQAAGRIGNDHILEVFDLGELPGGDRYIVMEFLDGEPMNTRLARFGRLAPRQVYPLVRQLLEGLGAAHAVGIVHRDLKPANVFILREKLGHLDYVKIIDFGISKFQAAEGQHNQTRTGTIIGTPSYMAPEQARGLREADARTDIYAVGVILYEAVTGRCPFEGASTNDLLFKIFLNEAPPIETLVQDVEPAFCSIVMKALAKEPNDRFARAEDFIAALDAWAQTGRGVSAVRAPAIAATMIERASTEVTSGVSPLAATQAVLPATQGAWTGSGSVHAGAPADSSKRVAIALAAVFGLVVLGGIGWGFFAARAGNAHDDGRSGATTAVASSPASPKSPALPPPAVTGTAVVAPEETPHVEAAPTATTPESIPESKGAEAESPAPAPHHPRVAPVAPARPAHVDAKPAAAPPNCNPPFTIDTLGHHVPKPECL